jgi:2-oxoglutarate ferredoxin oxidoreductase subunit beta
MLEHGRPLVFGKGKNLGIRLNGFTPEVVTLGENGITEKDLLVHNEQDPTLPLIYTQFKGLGLPVPMGIFKRVSVPSFDEAMMEQMEVVKEKKGKGSMEDLLKAGDTWEVK